MNLIKMFLSYLTVAITFLASVFGIAPSTDLKMDQFDLVWSDEFNAQEVDYTQWEAGFGERRGGYWSPDLISLRDGKMVIDVEYRKDGEYGEGFYTGCISTKKQDFTQGYYEISCKLPESSGIWSAFWLLDPDFGPSDTGRDGAEIDIFESSCGGNTTPWLQYRVLSAVHYGGYGKEHRSVSVGSYYIPINPYENFNTYGLEWNDDYYIFYLNGQEVARSNFGGTSRVGEYPILSVEVGGENGVPSDSWSGKALSDKEANPEFVIDYIRIYEYK